jgi:hypothetical protein
MEIRGAIGSDIDAAVIMVERHRRQYQKYQPTFWRKSAKSAETTRTFFAKLLQEPDTFFLAAVEGALLLGFLIARKFPTPPVYETGGDTYLVDDFCVAIPRLDIDPRGRSVPDRGGLRRPRSGQGRGAAPGGPQHCLELVDQAAALTFRFKPANVSGDITTVIGVCRGPAYSGCAIHPTSSRLPVYRPFIKREILRCRPNNGRLQIATGSHRLGPYSSVTP